MARAWVCISGRSVYFAFQAAPEGRKALDGQGFGTNQRGEAHLSKRRGHSCRGNRGGAHVVGQRFAFLRKAKAYEAQKRSLFNAQFCKTRGKPPAEDGRMHSRRFAPRFAELGVEEASF